MSPPIMPGWDGYPVRDALSLEFGLPGRARQRRQRAGRGRAARRRGPQRRGTSSTSRSAPASGAASWIDGELYRGVNGCAGDIGHIRVEDSGPTCACGNAGCLEAFAGGAALARDATAAARTGRSAVLAAMLEDGGELTAARRGPGSRAGRPPGSASDPRERAAGRARSLPGWCPSSTPDLIVIGGKVTGLGHPLLAEIRARDISPLPTAGHREPADRAQRAGAHERGASALPDWSATRSTPPKQERAR